jgi:hypothetical protein
MLYFLLKRRNRRLASVTSKAKPSPNLFGNVEEEHYQVALECTQSPTLPVLSISNLQPTHLLTLQDNFQQPERTLKSLNSQTDFHTTSRLRSIPSLQQVCHFPDLTHSQQTTVNGDDFLVEITPGDQCATSGETDNLMPNERSLSSTSLDKRKALYSIVGDDQVIPTRNRNLWDVAQ